MIYVLFGLIYLFPKQHCSFSLNLEEAVTYHKDCFCHIPCNNKHTEEVIFFFGSSSSNNIYLKFYELHVFTWNNTTYHEISHKLSATLSERGRVHHNCGWSLWWLSWLDLLIDPMTWSQPSEHPKSSCMTSVMLIFFWSYNWL